MNINLSTVRRIWQNNQAGSPQAETLLAIADVLGVTIRISTLRAMSSQRQRRVRTLAQIKSAIYSTGLLGLRGETAAMHASLSTVHWQCTRKAHYWSKAEAKAAQAEAKRIYGVAMRRYRCPFVDTTTWPKRNPDDATS